MTTTLPAGARERILETAYQLFSRRGIRAVGVDEVIARSQVAKATLYRHFPSKDDLVLAFLDRREQLWTVGLIERQARARGETPEGKLLAIFAVLDDWFRSPADFDACAFVNVLLEMGADHPLGQACIRHLDTLRGIVAGLAREAGLAEPEDLARSWHLLMKGAIVSAAEGDADAAVRAREMARDLLARHRK
ncbi:TetR/AcrR family transcriptional regulator [Amycolatopsis thermoflava]|uniref:TetR/AcrR family transcriptional regulator n=1 Tax=Amycolatopsis thermoflava TaxID=84480 RepID=UPI00364F4434